MSQAEVTSVGSGNSLAFLMVTEKLANYMQNFSFSSLWSWWAGILPMVRCLLAPKENPQLPRSCSSHTLVNREERQAQRAPEWPKVSLQV